MNQSWLNPLQQLHRSGMNGRAFRSLLALCILLFFVHLSNGAQWEDGYVYARYVRNALDGFGLVFNHGERVNALTSPLYSYLLFAVSRLLHGRVLLGNTVLFTIFMGGTCVLAEVLFPWAGVLFASCHYLYALIGLETPLFLFFILLCVQLFRQERYNWLPVALILLALCRFEGAAMAPVMVYACYRRRRWPAFWAYIFPLLIASSYLGFNHHFYGSILPASASAKIGQGHSGFFGKWPRAFLYGYRLGLSARPPFYSIVFMILALPFAIRRLRGTAWNGTALPFALILLCFYVLFNIPSYHWYYAPLILVGMLYLAAQLGSQKYGLVLLAILTIAQSVEGFRLIRGSDPDAPSPYLLAADWLNANTPADATVESLETGLFGWKLNRYLYDSLGLTEPKNAQHIAHRDFSRWLEEDRPGYVLFHTTRDFPFEKVILTDTNYRPTTYSAMGIAIYQRIPTASLPATTAPQ